MARQSGARSSIPFRRRVGRQFRVSRIGVVAVLIAMAIVVQFTSTGARAGAEPGRVKVAATVTADAVKLTLQNGSLNVHDGKLTVRDQAGTELGQVPLSYRMEYRQYPIDARVVGRTVTLTPVRDAARSTPLSARDVEPVRARADKDGPKTRQERDDQALARFNQQFSAGMSVSALVGLAIGAVVGGFLGCVLGLAAAIVGCFVAVAPAAALGSIAGTIIGGGGSAIAAAIQYFKTSNSPFRR